MVAAADGEAGARAAPPPRARPRRPRPDAAEGRRPRGLPRDPPPRRHARPHAHRARATTSTRSSGSSSAPTTTSPSRSTPALSSPASRRSCAAPTSTTAAAGRSRSARSAVDPRRREATVGDRRLELRAREFDLLCRARARPGVVLTRDALLEDVWGTDFPGETRTVDVHVAEVRQKLGDGRAARSRRSAGIGYRLVPPPREPVPVPAGDPEPGRPRPDVPRGLAGRIWLGVAAVALVALVVTGGGLFLALRDAHRDATTASLAALVAPLQLQIRRDANGGSRPRPMSSSPDRGRSGRRGARLPPGAHVRPGGRPPSGRCPGRDRPR